jgi:hypothetical protein
MFRPVTALAQVLLAARLTLLVAAPPPMVLVARCALLVGAVTLASAAL